MKIFVIDPGCQGVSSHHTALNLALQEEFQGRGFDARFLYSVRADEEIKTQLRGYAVLESFFVYNRFDHPRFLFDEFSHLNRLTEDELEKHLTPLLQIGDMVFVHTVAPSHLLGIAAWLRKHPDLCLKVRVIARFHPEHRIQEPESSLMRAVWQFSLAHWGKLVGHDIRLFADNEPLAKLYSQMGPLPLDVVPISIDFRFFTPEALRAPSGPILFNFLGDLRGEKGAHILFNALEIHARQFEEARYHIQLTNFQPEQVKISDSLRQRIHFLVKSLMPAEYYQLLTQAGVVLVPYDPKEYTYRTSHIFIEALGFGKPVITIATTWMDQELQKRHPVPGTVAAAFHGEALAQAMEQMTLHYPHYLAIAQNQAEDWRAKHNIKTFCDKLLAE